MNPWLDLALPVRWSARVLRPRGPAKPEYPDTQLLAFSRNLDQGDTGLVEPSIVASSKGTSQPVTRPEVDDRPEADQVSEIPADAQALSVQILEEGERA